MTLQSNVQSEEVIEKVISPYYFFGEGRVVDLMPQLTTAGYHPAGIAYIIDQRQIASTNARNNFNITLWTGDSAGVDEKGGVLLTLDSLLLRQVTQESTLVNGVLKLDNEQWQELKADREHSLYLNPPEVDDAHEKGYVLENGLFKPADKAVAKAWDHLNRGRDIKSIQPYARMVSENSFSENIIDCDHIMNLNFSTKKNPTSNRAFFGYSLCSLVISDTYNNSNVCCNIRLINSLSRLVGVAPERYYTK